jgi:cyclase
MESVEVAPDVTAFIRYDEAAANAGLIHTAAGPIVVDTTQCPPDMQALLDAAGVAASEVRLVINTHFHSDHVWGNQLFACPILAHRLCREKMEANLAGEWSAQAIAAIIAEREKEDPVGAQEVREKLGGLRVTLPSDVFDERRDLEIGGVRIEVIQFGGHTPDLCVVWLPQSRTLFASDLIFARRYPYLFDADIPAWIAALKRLPEFGAQAIVPGHGLLCGEPEIALLRDYLEATWARTTEHVARGHTADEAAADPAYPRFDDPTAARYHEANIRFVYEQLARGG